MYQRQIVDLFAENMPPALFSLQQNLRSNFQTCPSHHSLSDERCSFFRDALHVLVQLDYAPDSACRKSGVAIIKNQTEEKTIERTQKKHADQPNKITPTNQSNQEYDYSNEYRQRQRTSPTDAADLC